MPSLQSVIERLRANDVGDDCWLFITGDAKDLTVNSEVDLGRCDFDEDTGDEIEPPGFRERGLHSTIDKDTASACVDWGDRLAGKVDDAAAAEMIRYYIRFDAWPETLGAPDPPPAEETARQLDQAFCDALGPEDLSRGCRREGCSRGTVKLSVFCRRHHFESMRGKPYPFEEEA